MRDKKTNNASFVPVHQPAKEISIFPLLRLLWKVIRTKVRLYWQRISPRFSFWNKLPAIIKLSILGGMIYFLQKDFHFSLSIGETSAVHAEKASLGISEFAPADPESLRDELNRAYIERYKDVAIAEMQRTKIPASITLAQGIIESRSGDSRLAKEINNHFGIKCFSRKCKAGHCKNYSDDSHKDFFRKFKTVHDGYKAHSELLLNKRYTRRLNGNNDYRSWANALQEGGYATGDKYGAKLIRIIQMYNLSQYD